MFDMDERTKKSNIRVASYNIRKARGHGWRHDTGPVIDAINRLDVDVVALQEADHRLGDRPAAVTREQIERDTDFRVVPISDNDVSLGFHGNAVLARKTVEAIEVENIELPGLEPRGAVKVKISTPIEFTLVGVHLGLLRSSRRAQLQHLVERLGQKSTNLVLGDFNEWSDDKGLEPLKAQFSVVSPGKSFHAARPLAALDRFAHCQGLVLNDAGVIDDPKTRKASDHIPIWAEFEQTSAH